MVGLRSVRAETSRKWKPMEDHEMCFSQDVSMAAMEMMKSIRSEVASLERSNGAAWHCGGLTHCGLD